MDMLAVTSNNITKDIEFFKDLRIVMKKLLNRKLALIPPSFRHHKPPLGDEDMPELKQERSFSAQGYEESA